MTKKLRILHVVPYFPPDRIGGVGEVAAHLHRGLLEAGHDSMVLTSGTSHQDTRVRRIGRTPSRFVLGSAFESNLLRDCDLVHCHHAEGLGLLLMNKLRGMNVPVVCTYHCSCSGIARAHRPYQVEGRRFGTDFRARVQSLITNPVRHLLDRCVLSLVDQPNFISRHGAADMMGNQRSATASVIYYGLPSRDHTHAPSTPTPGERFSLLYAGTASHRKRINVLPFVLAKVQRRIPEAKLRIVGFSMADQPEFQKLAEEVGVLDSIECVGKKLSSQLSRYYSTSNVLLVPSAHEGLPMVILEAQQWGLPCVVTNVSGHPEVVTDGHNGFLVELDNPQQMADRCIELLQNPDLQQRMRREAQAIVDTKFSLDRQTDEYLELYHDTIAAANHKSLRLCDRSPSPQRSMKGAT